MNQLDFHGDLGRAFSLLDSSLSYWRLCLLGQGGGTQLSDVSSKEKMNIKKKKNKRVPVIPGVECNYLKEIKNAINLISGGKFLF